KTILYTAIALCAFAGNSVLCRLALGNSDIDPSSFTTIRLLSGIVILVLMSKFTTSRKANDATKVSKGSWRAAVMLFVYAATFSFAYVSLETGTGALILFAAVQITMVLVSAFSGNKLHLVEWSGLGIAFIGLVYLVLPGLATPSLFGFILMAVSGVAWAVYTLSGKTSTNPLCDTTYNFLRTLPFVIILAIFTIHNSHLTMQGILLAVLSGAIASGAGYTIWYSALGGLSTIQAAVLQLLVPAIAALGGVAFVDEPLSMRLVISSLLILGGILFVILGKRYTVRNSSSTA
ncbi:UNVERIFIED_CONTAM: hypothetical protein GTU68_000833, partial [Idotea baltica]|nr:hypothetical protein [Idotea baltica]